MGERAGTPGRVFECLTDVEGLLYVDWAEVVTGTWFLHLFLGRYYHPGAATITLA